MCAECDGPEPSRIRKRCSDLRDGCPSLESWPHQVQRLLRKRAVQANRPVKNAFHFDGTRRRESASNRRFGRRVNCCRFLFHRAQPIRRPVSTAAFVRPTAVRLSQFRRCLCAANPPQARVHSLSLQGRTRSSISSARFDSHSAFSRGRRGKSAGGGAENASSSPVRGCVISSFQAWRSWRGKSAPPP